jgi:hypothetical protein
MLIYKFKSFENPAKWYEALEIIKTNSIWCASPNSLNDSLEFNLKLNEKVHTNLTPLIIQLLHKHNKSISLAIDSKSGVSHSLLKLIAA